MKVKDITHESIEIKPAQQTPGTMGINIDGKQVGTADAQTAQTIAQASKDGKLDLDQTPDGIKPAQGAQVQEEPGSGVPYYIDMSSGKPMAKTGGRGLTQIVPSKMWTAITPEIILKAEGDGTPKNPGQGFRKVMLQHNGKQIMGLEGGDQVLGSKIIVAPTDFQSMSTPVRESDDELARWKNIAGV